MLWAGGPWRPPVPSRGNGLDYMEFRLWIGLHSALQCLVLVATDASFIIKYITRFTEEGFSTLISFIFIYDAIKKMIGAFKYFPINRDFKPDSITTYKCECVAPDIGDRGPSPPALSPAPTYLKPRRTVLLGRGCSADGLWFQGSGPQNYLLLETEIVRTMMPVEGCQ